MKRVLVCALVVCTVLGVAYAQVDLKGTWDMTVEGPQGPVPLTLVFASVEDQKITGTLETPQGAISILGTFSEAGIMFVGSLDMNGQTLNLKFTGKITDDTMSGDAEFGQFGSGTWSAKKHP